MTDERPTAPTAAPNTTAAPGAPARAAEPRRSWPTMDATVAAARYPVLPSATLANRAHRVRARARSIAAGESPAASWAMNDICARIVAGRGPGRSAEQRGERLIERGCVAIDVGLGRDRGHQRHVVEGRHEDA